MTFRTVVVDDEEPARRKLRRLLDGESDFEVVGEAASGTEAIAVIRAQAPDVVFLDIQMPEPDGFGVVAAVDDHRPYVVFVTAYDAHAIRAFEVRALDYLLKPVSPQRFRETAARVRERLARSARRPAVVTELREIAAALAGREPYLERLLVHDQTRAHFLAVNDIDWIEAERNYIRIHAGARVFTDRATIASLESRLDPAKFLRINRSQLIRLDGVKELHPWSHGDYQVVLVDGTRLTWSRRYRAANENVFRPRKPEG